MRRHDGPDRGIMRAMMRRLASVLVCLFGLAGPCAPAFATATDLGAQFAPGSIETRDDIARARAAVRSSEEEAEARWRADEARCAHVFFVNSCLGRARDAHLQAQREARRVTLEANARERKLDAQARAHSRAEAQRDAPTAEQRAAREARARADFEARQRRAEQAAADRARLEREAAERRAAQMQRVEAERARKAARADEAASRAANAREFAERQRQAAAYADQKAKERAENEKRRAARAREREQKLIEQAGAPPVSSGVPAGGKGDAAAPKLDLPADIPPPAPAPDDKPEPEKK